MTDTWDDPVFWIVQDTIERSIRCGGRIIIGCARPKTHNVTTSFGVAQQIVDNLTKVGLHPKCRNEAWPNGVIVS